MPAGTMSPWRRCGSRAPRQRGRRPGVIEALRSADTVVIAPSNPLISIGPILAVPGIREELIARRDRLVAISPIVVGAALKGPADRLMADLGFESSVVGVARIYAEIAAALVVDVADGGLVDAVEETGMRCVVAETVMSTPAIAAALAETAITSAGERKRAQREPYRDVGRRGHRRDQAR